MSTVEESNRGWIKYDRGAGERHIRLADISLVSDHNEYDFSTGDRIEGDFCKIQVKGVDSHGMVLEISTNELLLMIEEDDVRRGLHR